MTRDGRLDSIYRWNVLAYSCIVAALVAVLGITGWGAYRDFSDVRHTLLQERLGRLRSHAARTVSRIQDRLAQPDHTLDNFDSDGWLREHWQTSVYADASRLYAAVIDPSGNIVMHSDPSREGEHLPLNWYTRAAPEVGEEVVETGEPLLTGGEAAYDINIPIFSHDEEIGAYHSGMSRVWFHDVLAAKNRETSRRWLGILALMLVVVSLAGVSLFQIIKRTVKMEQSLQLARERRLAELGQLVAGIAHEIRNPLNAIRLNLHALGRMHQFDGRQTEEEDAIIGSTNSEIERLEGLMKIMLGYARPEQARNEDIDVRSELEGTLQFIRPVFDREDIALEVDLPADPAFVHMDRNRFRQIVLNLLNNAKEAAGEAGRVEVRLRQQFGKVEVMVADNGPGVPADLREQIFEPFFTTKELGTGLGLALVKRFVDEVGGVVSYDDNQPRGAQFHIAFTEVVAARKAPEYAM